jgi:hypothetical protein
MKTIGFTCDRQACGRFEKGEALPDGWVVLRPQVLNDDVKGADNTFEFCSNVCLAIAAADRALALDGTDVVPLIRRVRKAEGDNANPAVRLGSSAGVDNGLRARHTRWHTNRDIVDPDCEICIEESRPKVGDTRAAPR